MNVASACVCVCVWMKIKMLIKGTEGLVWYEMEWDGVEGMEWEGGEDNRILKSISMIGWLTDCCLCLYCLSVCVFVFSLVHLSVCVLHELCISAVCVNTSYQSPTQTYIHALFASREFQLKWNNEKITNCYFLKF